jgi:phosphotransferase system HPr-like phosphotransfer protein
LTSGFLNDTVVRVKATGKDAEAAVQVIEEVLSKEIY